MILGYLLARKGVDVIVLEKHADFLRDFRGDTVHPSILDVMYELGLLDEFLLRPHQEVRQLSGQIGNETVTIADFTHLPTHCRFIALMPQWDFLNFIAEKARSYSSFHLRTNAEVTDLIEKDGRVTGVRAKTPNGELEIYAGLIVGADGRHSVVRERAKLEVVTFGSPMDVMWMRISRKPDDPGQTFGHVDVGKILVLLNREDYWQCAYVIPKGKADEIRQKGIELFREEIARLEPFLCLFRTLSAPCRPVVQPLAPGPHLEPAAGGREAAIGRPSRRRCAGRWATSPSRWRAKSAIAAPAPSSSCSIAAARSRSLR